MAVIDYSIEHHETDKELIPYVRIVNKQPYINYAIYRLELSDLKKDDILSVSSELETTQDNKYVVQIASYIVLSPYENCSDGIIISKHNGFNITHEIHHGVSVKFRQFLIKDDLPGVNYLCTMIYPASLLAKSNDYLKIEQGTGHLDAVIYRNNLSKLK